MMLLVLFLLTPVVAPAKTLKVKVSSIKCGGQLTSGSWMVINTTQKLGSFNLGKVGWVLNTDESPIIFHPSKQKPAVVLADVQMERNKKTIPLHTGVRYCQEVRIE